jgi:arylsulfatase A-like enzyme/Flp pilus assembly protein TadD
MAKTGTTGKRGPQPKHTSRPKRTRVAFVAAILALAALAAGGLVVWLKRAPDQPLATGSLRGANVLLVTIDTLRADRVGAYGGTVGLTPTLDRLAREGLRFERAYAPVPLTLPSHASLMTGRYPTRTGVHDNGTFTLGAGPTLAAGLKAAGYRTGAFVGAFVLDARFGLNRGFDTYDDRVAGSSADLEVVQRTAEQVLAPAYDWIVAGTTPAPGAVAPGTAAPSARPWFTWVHLYDPHEPYDPPEPYRSRFAADPYGGEIVYADASLGAFLERLRASGGLENTLVVVAADHGESLGDHGERTHGLFAYDSTLRVPLLVWAPPRIRPAVVRTARLVDVAPTILDLAGVEPLGDVDGRSLRPAVTGEDQTIEPASYFEALNANLTRNWAPLRGIIQDGFKLIDLPVPELYDLAADPQEQRNLYAQQRDRARPLEAELDRITRAAPQVAAPAVIDADAAARLRALGYVVSSGPRPPRTYTSADDPKQLVHLQTALDDAAAMWSRGDAAGAMSTLQTVIARRPDLTLAYDRLASILRASGRPADAVAVLDGASRSGHADRQLLLSLGTTLRDAGDLPRSAAVLEALVREDPADLQSADALGQTYARTGRAADAERLFRGVLARSPNASTTWNNLGALYLIGGRTQEALDALGRAVTINPALATAHNGLGVAYARAGRIDEAIGQWQKAVELRPGYADAQQNLERVQKERASPR